MPIRDEERLTLWNRFFPLPLAANQVIKLPKGKYTEREKEMMTGVCSIPHHFFSATKKLTLTKPFLLVVVVAVAAAAAYKSQQNEA